MPFRRPLGIGRPLGWLHRLGPARVVVPAPLGDIDGHVGIAGLDQHLAQQLGPPPVDHGRIGGRVGGQPPAVGVDRQPVHDLARAGIQHPLQIVQVVHALRVADGRQRGGQRPAQDQHVGVGGLGPGIGGSQQVGVALRVHRAVAPLQADVGLIPDDDVVHAPVEMLDKGIDVIGKVVVAVLIQVGKRGLLLVRGRGAPTRAQSPAGR